MKYNYELKLISKSKALEMIQKYHYSNTLPKLNKYFVGFYLENELVGVVTLGYGTRPKHTIQRIFPSLDTKDYLEIGRMCMTEEMPKNSESQMISQLAKWLKKNHPEIKILFTWADGMMGKVGYVYQSCSFHYCGYSGGEFYMHNGIKLHPRQMKSLLTPKGIKEERIGVRPTMAQMRELEIDHYKGKQYRYFRFLCDKKEEKRLTSESLVDINQPYPKEDDLHWTKKNLTTSKWEECTKPAYKTDINQQTKNIVFGMKGVEQLKLFDYGI